MEQAAATKIRDPLAELARIFERSCELFGCRYAAMSARLGRQRSVLFVRGLDEQLYAAPAPAKWSPAQAVGQ